LGGREIVVPLQWFEWLAGAAEDQRRFRGRRVAQIERESAAS
jgi:hypothetical protein